MASLSLCSGLRIRKGRRPRFKRVVRIKRRCGRCLKRIGQVAPLDDKLGLQPNKKTCQSLKQAACALAVFVPYGLTAVLLTMLTGYAFSPRSIFHFSPSGW